MHRNKAMRRRGAGLALVLCIGACVDLGGQSADPGESGGSLPETDGRGKADDTGSAAAAQARWVDWHVNYTVNKVQYAGYNSGHYVGTYDPASFNAQAAWDAMRALDVERGCSEGRSYSHSRESAIELYQQFVEDNDPYQNAADHDPFGSPELHASDVAELVEDEGNLGVFASVYDSETGTDPESCLYHNFTLYREDGTAVRLEFNYTD